MSEGKKSKKAGKKLDSCKNYRTNGRQEINKAIKLIKVMDRNPTDHNAAEALRKLSPIHQNAAQGKLLQSGYRFKSDT